MVFGVSVNFMGYCLNAEVSIKISVTYIPRCIDNHSQNFVLGTLICLNVLLTGAAPKLYTICSNWFDDLVVQKNFVFC